MKTDKKTDKSEKTDATDLIVPRVTDAPAPARDRAALRATLSRGLARTVRTTSAAATALIERMPGSVDSIRASASDTTAVLQTLPDPTLRWLAAGSVGLGAGFYIAGVPRVMIAAAMMPAVLLGAAIIGRPDRSAVPA